MPYMFKKNLVQSKTIFYHCETCYVYLVTLHMHLFTVLKCSLLPRSQLIKLQ